MSRLSTLCACPFLIIAIALAVRSGLAGPLALSRVSHSDGPGFSNGDSAEVHRVRLFQSLAEEALHRCCAPLGREQEVDGLAQAVHRPIQVGPHTPAWMRGRGS